MKITVIGVVLLLVIMAGMLYISGLLQQEFPCVATWFGQSATPPPLAAPSPQAKRRPAYGRQADAVRDTRRPLERGGGAAPTEAAALELQGISWGGTPQRSAAVVNRRSLALGESIGGYVLRQITRTSVELTGHGERVRLRSNATREVEPLTETVHP